MSDQWHLSRGGEMFGPFTATQLQELAQGGRVHPSDMVYTAQTQQWYSAAEIEGLFPAAPAPAPEPVPEAPPEAPPEDSYDDAEEIDPPARRARRGSREAGMSPLYWMLPIGGACILGIITVIILRSGRGKSPPPKENPLPAPVVKKTTPSERFSPPVERAETPVDYSLPSVDYSRGPRGEEIVSKVDEGNPNIHFQVFIDDKGNSVLHGKREEFYPGTQTKKSQQWWYDGKLYGPYSEWDEQGKKTVEGQYARNLKNGKWVKYQPTGTLAEVEYWYRGKKHGPFTTYHANGKRARTLTYQQDQRTGPAKFFDENGTFLGKDRSLQADLATASYEEMIAILGPPRHVHEAPRTRGELYVWQTDADRFIAVWIVKDALGADSKGPVKGFQVSGQKIDQLKRQLR